MKTTLLIIIWIYTAFAYEQLPRNIDRTLYSECTIVCPDDHVSTNECKCIPNTKTHPSQLNCPKGYIMDSKRSDCTPDPAYTPDLNINQCYTKCTDGYIPDGHTCSCKPDPDKPHLHFNHSREHTLAQEISDWIKCTAPMIVICCKVILKLSFLCHLARKLDIPDWVIYLAGPWLLLK
jgi:hypothetical protein